MACFGTIDAHCAALAESPHMGLKNWLFADFGGRIWVVFIAVAGLKSGFSARGIPRRAGHRLGVGSCGFYC